MVTSSGVENQVPVAMATSNDKWRQFQERFTMTKREWMTENYGLDTGGLEESKGWHRRPFAM